ncbi:MAG: RNB domain-containing ribonuclease, partial [Candidatus Zixiibacteriota bacterium]
MPPSDNNLIKAIREKADRPMKMKELAKALGISSSEYPAFRNNVKKLINSGELVKLKRGRIGISSQLDVLVGKIAMKKSGIGFLLRENEDDILIPPTQTSTALDGDKVMIRFSGRYDGRVAGTVIKVVERTNRNIVGLFKLGKHISVVVPDNPRIHKDLYIPPDATFDAKDGEKVVAVLSQWDDPYLNPEGKVIERLGFPGQVGVDMLTIIKSFDLPEQFPEDVLTEAEQAAARLEGHDDHRLDLTNECIYTIDPHDAKDHDDAVSIEKTPHGYRLGVHIADVSHYVKVGSPLD